MVVGEHVTLGDKTLHNRACFYRNAAIGYGSALGVWACWPLGVGRWELGAGGLGGVGFFGADDDAVFDREGDGGAGEPISGLVESAGEDGWGSCQGGGSASYSRLHFIFAESVVIPFSPFSAPNLLIYGLPSRPS
jgi:hypothetical protein